MSLWTSCSPSYPLRFDLASFFASLLVFPFTGFLWCAVSFCPLGRVWAQSHFYPSVYFVSFLPPLPSMMIQAYVMVYYPEQTITALNMVTLSISVVRTLFFSLPLPNVVVLSLGVLFSFSSSHTPTPDSCVHCFTLFLCLLGLDAILNCCVSLFSIRTRRRQCLLRDVCEKCAHDVCALCVGRVPC